MKLFLYYAAVLLVLGALCYLPARSRWDHCIDAYGPAPNDVDICIAITGQFWRDW